jgi:hypothetical protein
MGTVPEGINKRPGAVAGPSYETGVLKRLRDINAERPPVVSIRLLAPNTLELFVVLLLIDELTGVFAALRKVLVAHNFGFSCVRLRTGPLHA